MKILKTSLKDMLETGKIGELEAGLERQELIEYMGNPEDWSVAGKRKTMQHADVWKYGLLEYSFGLSYIALEIHSKEDKLPANIKIEGFFPNSDSTLSEFMEFLNKHQVEAKKDDTLSIGSTITLKIAQNSIVFLDNRVHSIFLRNN